MAKNTILVRAKQLVLFISFVLLCSCNNTMLQSGYYQYYVGTMKIENPVVVEFEKRNDIGYWYVCPDSALYCSNDSDWLYRKDVFPYLPIVEFNPLLPTYYPRKELSHLTNFQWNYIPFYESGEIKNHAIYRFYYDANTFECYMQAIGWEIGGDVDVELTTDEVDNVPNNIRIREEQYRMVVRQKYNIFQILRLKWKYKDYFDRDH